MKTNFAKVQIILLAAGVILSGCSKEENPAEGGGDIGFNVAVASGDAVSRAAISGSVLPTSGDEGDFGIYGYNGASIHTDKNSKSLNNTRMNHNGSYQGDAVAWPSPQAALRFYAYFPYQATPSLLTPASTGVSLDYTLPADPTSSLAANLDWMFATNSQSTGSVNLTFTHALCRLVVKAKYTDLTTGGSTLVVKGVTVNNIYVQGDYLYNTSTTSSNGWTTKGTLNTRSKTLTNSLTKDAASTEQVDFFMIPQPKGTYSLTIAYSLAGAADKNLTVPLDNMPAFSERGKIYTVDLTIRATDVATTIDFVNSTIEVTDWTTGATTTPTVDIEK